MGESRTLTCANCGATAEVAAMTERGIAELPRCQACGGIWRECVTPPPWWPRKPIGAIPVRAQEDWPAMTDLYAIHRFQTPWSEPRGPLPPVPDSPGACLVTCCGEYITHPGEGIARCPKCGTGYAPAVWNRSS